MPGSVSRKFSGPVVHFVTATKSTSMLVLLLGEIGLIPRDEIANWVDKFHQYRTREELPLAGDEP